MADEPILCFDGDKAGRKAAFRAIETALPLIGAGKSLRFALLPEGQDPDDLDPLERRAGDGRGAAGARPFADMLFLRETEGRPLDTPEKPGGARAPARRRGRPDRRRDAAPALSGRNEAAACRAVRRGSPGRRRAADGRAGARRRAAGRVPAARAARRRRRGAAAAAGAALPQGRASRRAKSPSWRSLLGHPALLEAHWEEFAALDFAAPKLAAFRDALAGRAAGGARTRAEALARGARQQAGLAAERERILAEAGKTPTWWCLRAEAAPSDAEQVLRQSLALHRRAGALNRELKLAERALADEPNEQNFARLLDIKAQYG